jgi:D-aminopeptidase
MRLLFFAILLLSSQLCVFAQKPRARDIGIPFEGTPGKFNAITDVKGVEVGYSTIISGTGKNIWGKGNWKTKKITKQLIIIHEINIAIKYYG